MGKRINHQLKPILLAEVYKQTELEIPNLHKALNVVRYYNMKHSRIILTSLILIVTFVDLVGQTKTNKLALLANTKYLFKKINDYKNYKVVLIDNIEDILGHGTDNGSTLTGYFKKDSLKKVVEWVGVSNKVYQNEYYYNNDSLVFLYRIISNCRFTNRSQSFDCSKLEVVFEGRYYFSRNELFETILSGNEFYTTKANDYLDYLKSSKDYLNLIKSKRK